MAPVTSESGSSSKRQLTDDSASPNKKSKSSANHSSKRASSSSSPSKSESKEPKGEESAFFQLETDDPHQIGPILVSASDFLPPKDASFMLYRSAPPPSSSSSSKKLEVASLRDNYILAGENDSIDFVGGNWSSSAGLPNDESSRTSARGYSGDYMVGVYNPSTSSVTLRAAPLFTLTRSIKSLNSLSLNMKSGLETYEGRMQARRGLGEAFGNRKQQTQARNIDRMKVDTSNMEDTISSMRSDIAHSTMTMPNESAIVAEADQSRPIPPPNFEALHPAEAYPVRPTLIPNKIWNLVNPRRLEDAESKQALSKLLPPYTRNYKDEWLAERLWGVLQTIQVKGEGNTSSSKKITFEDSDSDSPTKASSGILKKSGTTELDARYKLKIGYYIALMWSFLSYGKNKLDSMESLLSTLRLQNDPSGELLLGDLLERFTESLRGQKSTHRLTNVGETKLLAYSFALCLHLDDFKVEYGTIALGLGKNDKNVAEIFKSLGCSSAVKTEDGTKRKLVVLKTPLTLPKPKRGGGPSKRS